MNLLDARGARFELRNLGNWIEYRVRQLVHCQIFAPMVGNEDGVFPDRLNYQRWEICHRLVATRPSHARHH